MPYQPSKKTSVRCALALVALGCSPLSWALQAPSKLQVPTLAFDDRQIILVWEKPAEHAGIKDYRVYANGTLLGSANANNDQVSPAKPYIDQFYRQDTANFHHRIGIHSFTAQGLKPDTAYRFTVRSVDGNGKESADSAPVSYPRFSRDGARIAWTSWRDGNPEVHTADPDGNAAGRLTYLSDAGTRVTGWTRDGEVLAVSAAGQPASYLLVGVE